MTADEVKAILGITDAAHDAQIAALLPVVEDWVQSYCNDDGMKVYGAGEDEFAPAVKGAIAGLVQFKMNNPEGKTSKRLGDEGSGYAVGFPHALVDMLPRKVGYV